MSLLLSLDPGTRVCGCALWDNGTKQLVAAGLAKNPATEGSGPRECAQMAQAVFVWAISHNAGQPITALALEWPQVYSRGGGRTKGDPNLLLPLVGVDAAVAVLFPNAVVSYYTPHDWKGSIEKPKTMKEPYVIESKVRDRLTPAEVKLIKWPENVKHTFDVTDGLGVGLHYLGRFARHRVYARE